MKKIFLIIALIVPFFTSYARKVKFDSSVTAGIKQIYDIKFDDARLTFDEILSQYPHKPQGKFFLAMIYWWKILLNPENESYDDIFYSKLDDVISQCDSILKKDPDNEEALFFKGGAIGFRGRLRTFRNSWLKAADDGRTALPIVEKAGKLDPDNVDVKLGYGIYNYFAAVIPDEYPLLKPLMIFFPPGNRKKGLEELKDVALNGKYAKYEARYFLTTLYYNYEQNADKADKWAKMLVKDFPDNPVFERWEGRISAKLGNYFKSSSVFKNVWDKAEKNLKGYNFPRVKREAAYYIAYEYRLQSKLDSAQYFFNQCVKYSNEVDKKRASGFIINSYLYLGMINDEWGNRKVAAEYYNKILDLRDFRNSHEMAKKYLKTPYKR